MIISRNIFKHKGYSPDKVRSGLNFRAHQSEDRRYLGETAVHEGDDLRVDLEVELLGGLLTAGKGLTGGLDCTLPGFTL